jgi:hypothetical protein
VHTKRNPTKKARKIKPLITNDQRNADTELPELVVLVAISLLRNPTRRKTLWEIGMGALFCPWLLKLGKFGEYGEYKVGNKVGAHNDVNIPN